MRRRQVLALLGAVCSGCVDRAGETPDGTDGRTDPRSTLSTTRPPTRTPDSPSDAPTNSRTESPTDTPLGSSGGSPTDTSSQSPTRRETPRSSADETPTPTPPDRTRTDRPADSPCAGTPDASLDDVRLAVGETHTTDEGVDVTLSEPSVAKSVTTSYVHTELRNPAGWQFVGVDYEVSGGDPCDFDQHFFMGPELVPYVDGERVSDPPDSHRTTSRGPDTKHVPFPIAEAESASVAWERATGRAVHWELDETTVADLADAPAFAVRTYELSYSRGGDGPPLSELTLTVENVGDDDGRFRALFDVQGWSVYPEIGFDVPAGESVTATGIPDGLREVSACAAPDLIVGGETGSVSPTVSCPTATPD